VSRLAYDPAEKKYYGIAGSGIAEVDLEKKSVKPIKESLDVPRISWPSDVTFDTKRKRLILLARGILYTYEPATGKWSALAEGLSATALVYSPNDDALYAAKAEREAVPSLVRLNAEGAVVKTVSRKGPVAPGMLPDGPVGPASGRSGPAGRRSHVSGRCGWTARPARVTVRPAGVGPASRAGPDAGAARLAAPTGADSESRTRRCT
jgi:hypothetical protein